MQALLSASPRVGLFRAVKAPAISRQVSCIGSGIYAGAPRAWRSHEWTATLTTSSTPSSTSSLGSSKPSDNSTTLNSSDESSKLVSGITRLSKAGKASSLGDDANSSVLVGDTFEDSSKGMTEDEENSTIQEQGRTTVRLAKFMANARFASRREAERMINEGKVLVNGVPGDVTTFVTDDDKVTVEGERIVRSEVARFHGDVFLCYKLRGELVTYNDPDGRPTLFQRLEQMGLPKNLISVGRLDFESEGLILLTTNGEFARYMELPESNIVRKYRARIIRGVFTEKHQQRLVQGITLRKGVEYRPIVAVERHTEHKHKANIRKDHFKLKGKKPVEEIRHQWLDVLVTEGKYREVRQALASMGLVVDRLIRLEYGPYALGQIQRGDVLRVSRRDLLAKADRKQKARQGRAKAKAKKKKPVDKQ